MAKEPSTPKDVDKRKPICGIIMPISAIPPKYDASHWADVKRVLDDAIVDAGMTPQIVSDSFESDVVQSRIIHNLYDNEMVVCDVSGLNPNVMFELGMRLTFNKPVVIVTDDFASIPFDTKVIEHVGYPTDLHIHKTVEFQKKLTGKILQILEQVKTGKYKSPLSAFGSFQIFQPTTETVPGDKYVAERMDDLFAMMSRLERRANFGGNYPSNVRAARGALSNYGGKRKVIIKSEKEIPENLQNKVLFLDNVDSITSDRAGGAHRLEVTFIDNDMRETSMTMREIAKLLGPDVSIDSIVVP
ncbi:hypothetical protein WAB17_13355 [Parerythrobacter aurantius]|uniref:hypothetical protein n=1 Tax=Parerythrobacter aurantius TaxID=3127706 RepID=UPI003244ABEF